MKNRLKKITISMLCILMLVSTCLITQAEEERITPSTVNYEVTFRDTPLVFLGNKTPVEWKVGKKYFLTYTVSEVVKDEVSQSGLLITTDENETYPYLKGGMYYKNEALISRPGYTYFFRFEVTEKGLEYVAIEAKGEKSRYLRLPNEVENLNMEAPYFGIWMAGGALSATFTHIRCYDEYGTDLGIYAPNAAAIDINDMTPIDGVNHSYSFSLKEASYVAFGNSYKTKSDVVFLEYTVQNVRAKDVTQSGALMTNAPTETWPHGNKRGCLNCNIHEDGDTTKLLDEEARYLVRFQRESEKFSVLVKCTRKDKTEEYFSFSIYDGVYRDDFPYVAMWFGEMCSVTADFKDVKCYDGTGKNLGIQTNTGVPVIHYGELEDYSQCEAVYYCKANNTFISLDDECNVSRRVADGDHAEQGTYSIQDAVMTISVGGEEETFDYGYKSFTDAENNRYIRMNESKVTFYSELPGGNVVEETYALAENGYKVLVPSEPTKKGEKFLGWKTADGEEYDFNSVVAEPLDLYAEWDGEGTWEFVNAFAGTGQMKVILITIIVSLLLIGATGIGLWMSRRKRYGKETK